MATASAAKIGGGMFVPLQLIEKCVGARLVCLLDDGDEVEGTLVAHDSTCTVVLSDATAFSVSRDPPETAGGAPQLTRTPVGKYATLVVNSRHIRVLVPGGLPSTS
uniref:Sm domain-containing protein n=1 Tax=Neobodo designis TaxID=312471 RepID=A0A7S1MGR6_NEODS|mmetsp:Transcript_40016/g.123646  ORF Transcript_40016/g.123646 Transcript_40016/m.123646 type:complete len:106 (+) Transcript_40016:51-368(+)|eukprot:CAMPEP_0174830518 /NCGR_PEP_ID=MMETSP1114-20130205/2566_1 /TAXON_ID=312471 /ORGANISM="Neobodo designis, Strain CCAP 1951/1" /LENGTH=105 /DNA_ID=CAMNT_0016064317 /DNA_START=47 /DNA_END=364 /DNA_ORIENTATION=-